MVSYSMTNEIKPDSPSTLMAPFVVYAGNEPQGSCYTLEKAIEVASQYPNGKVVKDWQTVA